MIEARQESFCVRELRPAGGAAIGTIAWIVNLYQTDADSPYRGIRSSTAPWRL
jgi:hypothetical protein